MNKVSRLTVLALLCGGANAAFAQGLPTAQPAIITIIREDVKVGREADHARIEAGWPAAYERAKSPDYYLAMTSMTGLTEAWYVVANPSHAAIAEGMKRDDANAVLTAELQRLRRADAEVVNSVRTIQAVARPDLSLGKFPDLARQRFFEIIIFRVRPGHEQEFAAAAKAYGAAAQRAAPNTSFRVYEVIAGMVGPTFFVFSSVESYGEFDRMMADGMRTMQGFTAEEMTTLQKFSTDGSLTTETQRFRVDPRQSYVSRETRAADPTFWGPPPRPAPARP